MNSGRESWRNYVWLLSFLSKYRGLFALFLLTGLVVSAVQMLMPLFIQLVIDRVIPSRDTGLLAVLIAASIAAAGIMIGAMAARNILQRRIQEQTSRDLQLQLFRHLRRLGFSYFERKPVGETFSMFQAEVPEVQNLYRTHLPTLVEKSATVLFTGIVLCGMNVKLALLIVPCFLLYYLVGPRFERRQLQLSKEGIERFSVYNKSIYDSVSGLLELRANGMETWDLQRLSRRHDELKSTWLKEHFYALMRAATRRTTINLGALSLFFFGYQAVNAGSMQVGEFVAFLLLYFRLMWDLTVLITSLTEQRILLVRAGKLRDFIGLQPDIEQAADPIILENVRGQLSFHDVRFGYRADRMVLSEFSLKVAAGERIALVGESGGGKSTLFKLIGRFYDPCEGEILLDGVPIRELAIHNLRDSIGYVFQETYLFGTSVKENIRFGKPDASDDEIMEAARSAYAHEFITQLPNGYDTVVGERGNKLSGGQKQRIAIARMLLKNPSIVLLDEATSALDAVSEREVKMAFDKLLRGRTTLAIAHRLATVRDYDRIVVLDRGRIVETGTYDELMRKQGGLYRLVTGEAALSHV